MKTKFAVAVILIALTVAPFAFLYFIFQPAAAQLQEKNAARQSYRDNLYQRRRNLLELSKDKDPEELQDSLGVLYKNLRRQFDKEGLSWDDPPER